MAELRKDYFLDRWVIVGTERVKRPIQLREKPDASRGPDIFAPGREESTPKEIGRLGSPWRIRWFPNKFPFLQPKGSAFGYHEIIVETPSKKQLWDLSEKRIAELLGVYIGRVNALEAKKRIRYVQIFKNHGRKAGTSILHSHTQVAASAFIPKAVSDEVAATKKRGKNCYKKIIADEMKSERKCFETKSIAAFSPFASRFNFELWIFPKRYVSHPSQLSSQEIKELASVIKKALARLRKLNASYNMFLHYAPRGKNLHLHFEVTPRIQNWAGYEISSGIIVNEVSPEDVARFYRGK